LEIFDPYVVVVVIPFNFMIIIKTYEISYWIIVMEYGLSVAISLLQGLIIVTELFPHGFDPI
jgi:hypothetical protein